MHADRITDSLCYHGEGPHWSASWGERGALRWVDMLAGEFLEMDPRTGAVQRTATGSAVVACVRPRSGGGAVLAIEKGFALQDPDGSIRPLPALWEGNIRMNEGSVAPDGSFYCGSMHYEQEDGAAAVWRLMPDGRAHHAFGEVTISNGLAFSPDRSIAYYVDTPTDRIDMFTWSSQEGLIDRRPFADLAKEDGHPDGACVDREGNVWVAMNGGSQVLCVQGAESAEHGGGSGSQSEILERVSVGAKQVTACTFGGEDLATLFITTSRESLDPGEDPTAGSLYALKPGAHGIEEELTFRG